MSFFVSDNLKDRISENDLVKNNEDDSAIYEDSKEHIFTLSVKIDDSIFEIEAVKENIITMTLNYSEFKEYLLLTKNNNTTFQLFAFDNLIKTFKDSQKTIEYVNKGNGFVKLIIEVN